MIELAASVEGSSQGDSEVQNHPTQGISYAAK